jgi:hypothetical protein
MQVLGVDKAKNIAARSPQRLKMSSVFDKPGWHTQSAPVLSFAMTRYSHFA